MEIMKHCPKINERLLPMKVHYFTFFAALACALPFRTVFAKQLGISATEVGVIFCAVPFLRMVTNPLFGFILDYFKRFRLTLSVIMIFVALSHVAMIFIPSKTSIPHDGINITEGDFHSKFRYLCLNDTRVCEPMFILHNEYKMSNALRQTINFTCDMQCSYSRDITLENKESIQQCPENMRFDFNVAVGVSRCDIDIRLESGKFVILDDSIRNSVSLNINGSSVRELKSRKLSNKNCSVESPGPKSFLSTANYKAEKKSSGKRKPGESDISDMDNVGKHVDAEEAKYVHVKYYYSLNDYAINFFLENFDINGSCNLEFDCETKKCLFNARKYGSIAEQFTADDNEFLSTQFWGLFMLIALSNIMFNTIIFTTDAVCYELLQNRRDEYGQQRLWATIGWGVGALAGGYINQVVTGNSGIIDYAPSFYLLAILTLIDLIPMCQLKITDIKYSSHICKDVCFLFSKFDIVYNIVIVYFIGALSGFIWNYQFWFMQEIGSSQTLLGLSQTFECIFETPCFIISGWIIQKIGHDHCNSITVLCIGLRYLCFVFMYNPWWTLAAAVFHGPTFGLFYASMTMYAKNKAPPGTEATVQSLLNLSFEGIGVASGSILGGIGLDKFGCRTSFMYAAEISFLLLFVNVLAGVLFSRTKKDPKEIKDSI